MSDGEGVEAAVVLGAAVSTENGHSPLPSLLGSDQRRKAPLFRRLVEAGSTPSTADFTLVLGTVPSGRVWEVRRVSVAGSDSYTTVAGATAAVFAGPDTSLPCLVVPGGPGVPNVTSFSREDLMLHSGDQLSLLIHGAASGTDVMGTALIADWRAEDIEGGYI